MLAELDLAIPECKIGVECQSWRWHASPAAKARDSARKRRLRLLGWELVEVWWTDLGRMDELAAELMMLIDARSTELSSQLSTQLSSQVSSSTTGTATRTARGLRREAGRHS